MHFSYELPFGAQIRRDGAVRFRLWAPSEKAVAVVFDGGESGEGLSMEAAGQGWFELVTKLASTGTRYKYRLRDGFMVPDPASRFQPDDVHGASQVVDPASYEWQNGDWKGRPWEDTVLYEAHLGCFTPEGGYDGARRRLDHLAGLGITALELMPLSDFEGKRNWGYDGVLPFAPDSAYGTPDELKRLIDEAHGRGIMVFLDVVYNHLGPSGNYLSRYARDFFTDRHRTPWGDAINFDGDNSRPVRDFFLHNALYWLEEFRFDGLRLDAVHAIKDDSRPDFLEEIATAVHDRAVIGRHIHLVLENDNNAARYLGRVGDNRPRYYTAQWNDDFHHAAHVASTGERWGYYADYVEAPVAALARTLTEGFAYQGEASRFRKGARRGEVSRHLPPAAFIAFVQNHDQIGNRAFGERLSTILMDAPYETLLAILLLSPQIPMLFMGEEWGARSPFLFFCDFTEDLATAVREGRLREFSEVPAFRDHLMQEEIPDPNALETFERSRLKWEEASSIGGRRRLKLMARLLRLRRERIVPRLAKWRNVAARYEVSDRRALHAHWELAPKSRLHLIANLSSEPAPAPLPRLPEGRFYAFPDDAFPREEIGEMPAWSVYFAIEPPPSTP